MKYSDPQMEAYYSSLPPKVKSYLHRSRVEISTLGELMQIGEHFRHSFGLSESQDPPADPGAAQ